MNVWAVVPVKPFSAAKQRLADTLQASERAALSRLMLQDTLQALARVPQLAGRLVVSADAQVRALARRSGVQALAEPSAQGLNAAVQRAARHVQQRGADAMLVVPGDVPGLQPSEVTALIEGHVMGDALSLVPAHDGGGTNAWLLSPPRALTPAFGPGSYLRHQQTARAAGLALRCRVLPSFGLDLDHASDLQRFVSEPRYANTRTAGFLRQLESPHPGLQRALAERLVLRPLNATLAGPTNQAHP